MSIRADKYRRNAQIKIYKQEIAMYEQERATIPWYTFDKEKRKYRADLALGIKIVKDKLKLIE